MFGTRFPLPSRAMLVALTALFVALGGTAYSATNGNFILGTPNSATSTTALSANLAGKTLVVSNPSTALGATPLGLTAGAGRPPFTTNSTTKVTNLNADQLDGKDSTAFFPSANIVRINAATITDGGDPAWSFGDLLLSFRCQSDGMGGVGLTGEAESLASSDAVYQGTIQDWNNDGTSHATTYIHRYDYPGYASSGAVSQAAVPAGVVARQIHTFVWFTGADTITGTIEVYLDGTADTCQVEGTMTRTT